MSFHTGSDQLTLVWVQFLEDNDVTDWQILMMPSHGMTSPGGVAPLHEEEDYWSGRRRWGTLVND